MYDRGAFQRGRDRGSLPQLAVNTDGPATLMHAPVDNRQAEPCTETSRLGREEWLEHMIPGVRIHPAARIAHRQPHTFVGIDVMVMTDSRVIRDGCRCFDRN